MKPTLRIEQLGATNLIKLLPEGDLKEDFKLRLLALTRNNSHRARISTLGSKERITQKEIERFFYLNKAIYQLRAKILEAVNANQIQEEILAPKLEGKVLPPKDGISRSRSSAFFPSNRGSPSRI